MSRAQDIIHRFIIDATIVTGCVCLVFTTRGILNTMSNLNNTVTQFKNVTIPKINDTINETRSLIAQINGKGIVVGGTIHNINQTIDQGNRIMEQLLGHGVVADSVVGSLVQTIAQINNILAQINGTKVADAGILRDLNSTIERLKALTDQGNDLVAQINGRGIVEGGLVHKGYQTIDGLNAVLAQLGNRTVALTPDVRSKFSSSIFRMLGCYDGYSKTDSTKESISSELFGDKTYAEIEFMAAVCETLIPEDAHRRDFHVTRAVLHKIEVANKLVDEWFRDHSGQDCSSENLESFCKCLKELNATLHAFENSSAVTEHGEKPIIVSVASNIDSILTRFKGESILSVLLRSPQSEDWDPKRFMSEVYAGV